MKYMIPFFISFLFSIPLYADTLIKQGCSKDYIGWQWFIYEDDDGVRYTIKKKTRKCGYRRYLNLSMEKEYGDRFDPAIVKVDYKDNLGNIEPWGMVHHKTTIGRAVRLDRDTVAIYGDGRIGDGIFTLGRTEIQFRIEEEPVCEFIDDKPSYYSSSTRTDCQGYTQKGGQELIYYGEDDDRIVTWELGILIYASHAKYGNDVSIEILDEYDESDYLWEKWERMVTRYNSVYEKSGIHIRYKLTKLYLAHWHSLRQLQRLVTGLPVDITLGRGTTYPDTCGVADVTTYFKEGKPPTSMSVCTYYTDLHELGHSVGLAHGPENQAWQARGYIFPDFGHGYNDICGKYDDIMSYGYNDIFHSNSKLFCNEIFTSNYYEGVLAGGREFSDTSYALNRVRYNVSLIHKENDYVDEDNKDSRLKPIMSKSRRIGIEVID